MQPNHLLVVDGNNLMHRSHHALGRSGLTRSDGEPVWATHGMLVTLAKAVRVTGADRVVVALDAPGGCPARRAQLPSYKANRSATVSTLAVQLYELPMLLDAAGLSGGCFPGWEADDVMASLARWSSDQGGRCSVLTSDRDAYQLLSPSVEVLKPDLELFDEAALLQRHGLSPYQYLEMAAIRGEPGDNIDGVPGVGEKTAVKLLQAAGNVDTLLAEPQRFRSFSARGVDAIVDHADLVRRNISVATLRHDLPVDIFAERGSVPKDLDRLRDTLAKAGVPAAGRALADSFSSRPSS
jgi:5'-3' exonuclease